MKGALVDVFFSVVLNSNPIPIEIDYCDFNHYFWCLCVCVPFSLALPFGCMLLGIFSEFFFLILHLIAIRFFCLWFGSLFFCFEKNCKTKNYDKLMMLWIWNVFFLFCFLLFNRSIGCDCRVERTQRAKDCFVDRDFRVRQTQIFGVGKYIRQNTHKNDTLSIIRSSLFHERYN